MTNISRSIHISNGNLLIDPKKGEIANSLTIVDGFVESMNQTSPPNIMRLDLNGRTLVPAFVDSHLHLTLGAQNLGHVDLTDCLSKDEFQQILLSKHNKLNESDWLIASGWSEQSLGEIPSPEWIPPCISRPTVCYRKDLHSAMVNQSTLEQSNAELISTLVGGEHARQGIVKEDALFYGLNPSIPRQGMTAQRSYTQQILEQMQRKGLSLIGSMETLEDTRQILEELDLSNLMRIRVMCLDQPTPFTVREIHAMHQSDFLCVTGFKAFLDGSLGSRTAKLYEPWVDSDGSGQLTEAYETIHEWVSLVAHSSLAPVIHAIGDEAVGIALNALRGIDQHLTPRIEHAQLIHEKDFGNISEMVFGVQPLHYIDDSLIATQALGEERANQMHNWRRMIDEGAVLSFGSDWPVATFDPLRAMQIAIQKGITPHEALIASTSDAALSLRSPLSGTLKIGSYGDCVVLDRNPLKIDWNTHLPKVDSTIFNGTIVFNNEPNNSTKIDSP